MGNKAAQKRNVVGIANSFPSMKCMYNSSISLHDPECARVVMTQLENVQRELHAKQQLMEMDSHSLHKASGSTTLTLPGTTLYNHCLMSVSAKCIYEP